MICIADLPITVRQLVPEIIDIKRIIETLVLNVFGGDDFAKGMVDFFAHFAIVFLRKQA